MILVCHSTIWTDLSSLTCRGIALPGPVEWYTEDINSSSDHYLWLNISYEYMSKILARRPTMTLLTIAVPLGVSRMHGLESMANMGAGVMVALNTKIFSIQLWEYNALVGFKPVLLVLVLHLVLLHSSGGQILEERGNRRMCVTYVKSS